MADNSLKIYYTKTDEAPALACPTDVNQTADAGNCDAFIDIDVPATSDNCGVVSVVNDYTGTDDATGTYAVGTDRKSTRLNYTH